MCDDWDTSGGEESNGDMSDDDMSELEVAPVSTFQHSSAQSLLCSRYPYECSYLQPHCKFQGTEMKTCLLLQLSGHIVHVLHAPMSVTSHSQSHSF